LDSEAARNKTWRRQYPVQIALLTTPRFYLGVQQQGDYAFLLLLLVAVRLSVNSIDRSRNLPRIGKEDRVLRGVGQNRQVSLRQRKGAGRVLETAGSTDDLKGESTVSLQSREIYAIASLREIDLQ
jgi:hypothetical protein